MGFVIIQSIPQGKKSLFPFISRIIVLLILLQCIICYSEWELLPGLTGIRQAEAFGEFTITDELELGKKFNILVRSRMPLILDPEVVNYVNSIVERLNTGVPPQPFSFSPSVIRDNSINAFAVPGGYIFVHTGLIMAMESEDEVAGVLAHEMAHVTQRHIASRIEKSQKINILSMLGVLAGAFMGGDAGMAAIMGSAAAGQTAMLQYSRTDETESDQVGMNYLIAANYPPQGMVNAFKVLQRPQWVTGIDIPAYLSTHPAIAERINSMESRINSMPNEIRNRKTDNTQFMLIQTLIRGRYADPEAAAQFFEKQAKGKDKKLAYFGQAILNARLNRIKDAETYFDTALQLAPNEQIFIREAGRFHYLKGDNNKATELLTRAIRQNEKDYMAKFFYARLLADYGKHTEAMQYYKEILTYVPEDSEVHYYYAQSYGRKNELFKAYLHLAYSAMYENNREKTSQHLEKAKGLAVTPLQKEELESFIKKYDERSGYWN